MIGLGITLSLSMAASGRAQSYGGSAHPEVKETSRPAPLFRAGASAVDVAPVTFPVLVNGGFLRGQANKINDSIRAKCLILDDGTIRLAIVVVDT
jgi:hypothetical protein